MFCSGVWIQSSHFKSHIWWSEWFSFLFLVFAGNWLYHNITFTQDWQLCLSFLVDKTGLTVSTASSLGSFDYWGIAYVPSLDWSWKHLILSHFIVQEILQMKMCFSVSFLNSAGTGTALIVVVTCWFLIHTPLGSTAYYRWTFANSDLLTFYLNCWFL